MKRLRHLGTDLRQIPSPLSDAMSSQRRNFEVLAAYWLDAGASAFGVWDINGPLAHWPPTARIVAPYATATLHISGIPIGQLRLAGADGTMQTRLESDARFLSQIIALNTELDTMTTELVSNQDQLVALYNLSQSLRNQLSVTAVLSSLAQEVCHLVEVDSAFAVLVQDVPIVEQCPAPIYDPADLLALFAQVQTRGHELFANVHSGGIALAPGMETLLLIPIEIRGVVVAGLGLVNKADGAFASPDAKIAQAISQQAGAQIENVLLYQESLAQARLQNEMEVASRIQLQLLPRKNPTVPGLDIFGRSRPALHVGGDFYDFVQEPGQPFVYSVGDVSGKGVSAALLMSMTHTIIRNAARFMQLPTPQDIIERANKDLYDPFTEVGLFSTAFVGQYDPEGRVMRYANAGHSPVVLCPVGGPARLMEADGIPLGVLTDTLGRDQLLIFRPDDVLVVMTDGFSEARTGSGELFGYERLLRLTEQVANGSAQEIADALFAAIDTFSNGHAQDDDQTLVVIKGV